ncbi:MAG: fatty acid desaturase, partial [Planctomycetaceae bacterium]
MAAYTEFTDHERQALAEPSLWPRLVTIPALGIGLVMLVLGYPSEHLGWRLFWVVFTTYPLLCWGSI